MEKYMELQDRVNELTHMLQKSEARFRNVIWRSANGIIIVNQQGIILLANPVAAELFERSEAQLVGENFGFPVSAGDKTEFDIVSRGRNIIVEVQVTETEWDEDVAYLLTMRDITERRRFEQRIEVLNAELAARAVELEAANEELEAFNYSVAHDLRQPLHVINGYCQVLKNVCGDSMKDECKGYIEETFNCTLRMNGLIDALLSFSRLAHAELKRTEFDIGTVANEIALSLRMSDPGREVDLQVHESPMANADPNLMRVALGNLLENAWKYTGMQVRAVIEFGAMDEGGRPVYFVRDNGVGFASEDASKLFLPFQRLHGQEQFNGFGIGLATVERIISRHGGRIWADGEEGKGATFFFTLGPDAFSV